MAFYTYITEAKIGQERSQSVGVLYYYDNGEMSESLNDPINTLTNKRISPQHIVIFCEKGHENKLETDYKAIEDSLTQRLQITDSIYILPYGYDGKIVKESVKQLKGKKQTSDGENLIPDLENLVSDLISSGIKQLVEETGVTLTAPVGYVFQKPSLHLSRCFYRAGNMLRNPSSLSILSHALLRLLPDKITILYIDSSTILAIALAFQKTKNHLAKQCSIKDHKELTIRNFHSYALDSTFRFATAEDRHILISATSSGSLAEKLTSNHGVNRESIWHIVSVCDDEDLKKSSVYYDCPKKNEPKHSLPLKKISIRDEEFIASHSNPIPIRLTLSHVCSKDKNTYKHSFYQSALQINLRAKNHDALSIIGYAMKSPTNCPSP